jgi:hypothetical protein
VESLFIFTEQDALSIMNRKEERIPETIIQSANQPAQPITMLAPCIYPNEAKQSRQQTKYAELPKEIMQVEIR